MPKRKDKSKSKTRIKSKNNKNKNKNTINIKIIGGQGGGGGGGGATSSHIPHPSHHQDIDYDRIRNILHQTAPRSTLTKEAENPPPVYQALGGEPNYSTFQNMQMTPNERVSRTTAFDYADASTIGKMSAQTTPIVNLMHLKKNHTQEPPVTNLNNELLTKTQEKRNINNANYDEYRELKIQCESLGNHKEYKNNIKGKKEMIKWLDENNTKSG